MVIDASRHTQPATAGPSVHPGPSGRQRSIEVAVAWVALGLSLVVGSDGSVAGRLLRLLLVGVVAVAAMVVIRRAHARLRAVVGLAVGAVGAAAGGGIGARFGSAGLWSTRTVGALLALVAGVVLLVVAVIQLVRACRRWWARVLLVPAIVLATFLAGEPIVIAVAATNVPRSTVGADTPGDRGFDFVEARFRTSDGVLLSGWYIPSTNGAAVVVLHGASSSRSIVLDQAVVLAGHGYGVLLYDARGLGRSGGRAMNLGWYGDEDVTAAIDYLAARPEVDDARIAALGESMGGEQALGAMGADARLRAVVAEGATNRVAADLDWLSDVYGVRGTIQQVLNRPTYALTDLLTDADQPDTLARTAATAAPRPVFLITAGRRPDEAHAAEHVRSASPSTVEVWTARNAGHTGGLRAHPQEWERRVVAFLDHALRVRR